MNGKTTRKNECKQVNAVCSTGSSGRHNDYQLSPKLITVRSWWAPKGVRPITCQKLSNVNVTFCTVGPLEIYLRCLTGTHQTA